MTSLVLEFYPDGSCFHPRVNGGAANLSSSAAQKRGRSSNVRMLNHTANRHGPESRSAPHARTAALTATLGSTPAG